MKFMSYTCDSFPTTSPGKDSYVLRSTPIYPSHELHASEGLPSMCREVSGQLQRQKFLMSRSVSSHGLRSIDLLREPSRYRSLSPIPEKEALPYGPTGQGIPEHSCRGKRNSQLTYVCRLCPLPDRYCPEALPGRTDRSRSGADDVCLVGYDHRSYAYLCFHGPASGDTRVRSNSILFWSCGVISHPLSTFPEDLHPIDGSSVLPDHTGRISTAFYSATLA